MKRAHENGFRLHSGGDGLDASDRPSFAISDPDQSQRFPHFRIGADLVGTGDLYTEAIVEARQQKIFGMTNSALLPVRIPAYYSILKPLAFLPLTLARAVWLGAILTAMCLAVFVQPQRYRGPTAVAFFWCGATLFSILYAQDAAFTALGLAGFQRLREANRAALAGLVLALAMLSKPHLLVLVYD